MARIDHKDFLRRNGFRHLQDVDRGAYWGNGIESGKQIFFKDMDDEQLVHYANELAGWLKLANVKRGSPDA